MVYGFSARFKGGLPGTAGIAALNSRKYGSLTLPPGIAATGR